VVED
jgi:hypothetical protein